MQALNMYLQSVNTSNALADPAADLWFVYAKRKIF